MGNRARRPPAARKAWGRGRNSRTLILLSPLRRINYLKQLFSWQILARCGSEVGADAGAGRPRFLFSCFFCRLDGSCLKYRLPQIPSGQPVARVVESIHRHLRTSILTLIGKTCYCFLISMIFPLMYFHLHYISF